MARWKVPVTIALIAAVLAVAVFLVFRFIAEERERALLNWQSRMSIVADSRRAAVESWLAEEQGELRRVAAGTAAPIYVAQIVNARERGGEAAPEAQFLRNLLAVTASRTGYDLPVAGPDVGANVERVARAGIAIVDRRGRILARTRAMPPIDLALQRFLRGVDAPGVHLYDLHESAAGEVSIGFAAPIFRPQMPETVENIVGFVVALKPVAAELYPLLRQPGASEATAEAVLLRRDGAVLRYLSPLLGEGAPLARQMAVNTPGLAGAFAIETPGGFGTFRDYRGETVLALSRPIEGTPWTLMYKVDRAEALADTERRLERLLVILLLAVTLAGAAAVGLWRHGASRRAASAAREAAEAAARLQAQRDLLRVVTDNQPNAIYIVDEEDRCRFANEPAAALAGMAAADMRGKTIRAILGADRAKRLEMLNRAALASGLPETALDRPPDGGRIIQSKHVPFAGADDIPPGVLIVEEDVTDAITERERRARNLERLVDGLLTLVDRRDPNAADHSMRVAKLGEAVAREMDLGDVMAETARFAGELMNVGKLMVPEAILTKPGKLTDAELRQVHEALDSGADLLAGIEFDGPVLKTIKQARERWDGSGPTQLAGEDILPSARIVAAANALVAMTSPRAHRPGMPLDAAMEALTAESDKAYDRRVLAALANYLENRGGREVLTEGP